MAENRIARIKSTFLEDDATSLNGRKYPAQTVNRLVQSAQAQLSDPNALPLTVYLSHDAAYDDATNQIVGKIAAIGKEGTQAYALIDIPDTQAGREVVNLVKGGYIKSQSLRAVNAEMYIDKDQPYPMVGGENIRLTGIDFTSSPGIPNARVEYVSESKEPQDLTEIFEYKDTSLIEEFTPSEALAPKSLNDVHDHIATAMGMNCAPGNGDGDDDDDDDMEHALKFLGITEVGAKFSAQTTEQLTKAHDGLASYLGMKCMTNKESKDIPESPKEQEQPMTPEEKAQLLQEFRETLLAEQAQQKQEAEKKPPQGGDATIPVQAKPTAEDALKLLQEAGYTVAPPKTQEEIMQEKLDQKFTEMQTAFTAKLDEMQQKMNPRYVPQRKSMVEGSTTQEPPKKPYYRRGDYLKEQLRDVNTRLDLLDRSKPLPEGMKPEWILKELEVELMGLMDAQQSLDGSLQMLGEV